MGAGLVRMALSPFIAFVMLAFALTSGGRSAAFTQG